MSDTTTAAWADWQQQVAKHLHEHGLLPTPTTEGLEIPFEVASECWMVADTSPEDLPSLCRVTDAMGTDAERAAVLLFLSYLSNDEPYLRLPEPEEAERRVAVQKLYADSVSLLPVDHIDATWRIRWELAFAASAGLWDRTQKLVQQWSVLAPSEEREALTALARINFLSVHPARSGDWLSDWWIPYEGSTFSRAGDLFVALFAARLDARPRLDSSAWALPHALDAGQFARVLDADTALARLQDSGAVDPVFRLVRAWCSAVVGVRLGNTERTRDAAKRYAAMARDADLPAPLSDALDGRSRKLPAWSASVLFQSIGDLDSALDMTTLWTEIEPESPDGWKLRAEIQRRVGIEQWADSYERYVQLSPETDTSWEHSELLRLLLESRDQNTADRALRGLALEHPDRSVVEEMLTWGWDAYHQLHESTRERWWDGLVFVCDARVRKAFRRAPWRYAAACFGEAVALELRERIFGPFAAAATVDPQALRNGERRMANAILGSKATLGTMVEALALATDSRSELGQLINRFLNQKHRPLRSHMQSKTSVATLRAATESRNDAVHGDITPDEAKHVYRAARTFLDMLVKEDPRILDT